MNRLNSKNSLLIVIVIFVVATVLYIPKIYLRNNIYYTSRDINKLNAHYISLKEENRFLRQQLEDMKFKNQIMDSLMIDYIQRENLGND